MEVSWGAPWDEAIGVAVLAAAVYLTVFVAVRLAGRRTVSQMSAFDFLVTVAIGSLVATTVLSPDVGYVRGIVGIGTFLLCQQAVALIRRRVPASRKMLDFPPETVYENDRMKLRTNPLTAQVNESELRSKLRQKGIGNLDSVRLVVLEPDGKISVWDKDLAAAELWDSDRPDARVAGSEPGESPGR